MPSHHERQDEQNLKQNETMLSLSRGNSFRRSLVGDVPSIVHHQPRESLDGSIPSHSPWDTIISPSATSASSMDGLLSGRASTFARMLSTGRTEMSSSQGGVSPAQPALPASKQQLLAPKRTASGRHVGSDSPVVYGTSQQMVLNNLQQSAELLKWELAKPARVPHKSSSLRVGTGPKRHIVDVPSHVCCINTHTHTHTQEGSGFVPNALHVGRELLEQEGLLDDK